MEKVVTWLLALSVGEQLALTLRLSKAPYSNKLYGTWARLVASQWAMRGNCLAISFCFIREISTGHEIELSALSILL